jgi:hypothetical protein
MILRCICVQILFLLKVFFQFFVLSANCSSDLIGHDTERLSLLCTLAKGDSCSRQIQGIRFFAHDDVLAFSPLT